jgi:hypothetical protein
VAGIEADPHADRQQLRHRSCLGRQLFVERNQLLPHRERGFARVRRVTRIVQRGIPEGHQAIADVGDLGSWH